MAGEKYIVTKEKFESGFTYKQYIDQIKVNKDRFDMFYESGKLESEDEVFFQNAKKLPSGIKKLMIIGEDWCPDVFRGMPVFARIAEAANLETRIFPRDENLDMMNEFLKNGEFMSIPVAVFYDENMEEIARWIERPEIGYTQSTEVMAKIEKEMAEADEQDKRKAIREQHYALYPSWQKETVVEVKELLSRKLNI
jgi:thiol-disulfide isomerase/thioredoxin